MQQRLFSVYQKKSAVAFLVLQDLFFSALIVPYEYTQSH